MKLFIVRHAWAGEAGDPQYPDDSLRPLTSEGRTRFREVVRALAKRGMAPNIIATSPLVRCRQTAEIIVEVLGGGIPLVELPALAPESDLKSLVAWTQRQQAEAVAWVGHAPDVGLLAAEMIGDCSADIRFAKGTIACIDLPGGCARAAGQLVWLATAKSLGL
jgi:phosphohistidine phosphatase